MFKPFLEKLDIGIKAVGAALNDWNRKQTQLADAARMKVLTEQAQKIAEAKETGEVVEFFTTEVIPEVAKTSHAHLGDVTYRGHCEISVVNPDLVPRDLCDPSLSKIRKRAESGVKDIPGVIITWGKTPVGRGR